MRKFKIFTLSLAVFLLIGFVNVSAEEKTTCNLSEFIDGTNCATITLQEDSETITSELEISTNVTIDLNGKTLNASNNITVTSTGSLTVKDSSTGGNITFSAGKINVKGGTFTLESGAINVPNNYGVYCSFGGTAIINGGSITSLDSPLAGNNTTGVIILEVNGGVLTASRGPAIYMPSPISLTITGGTLNGGISLRMGIVNISGGVINSISDNIDSPSDETYGYSYSGNAWFPDALYVFGGTYTATSPYTNDLVLNITGGEFNCKNTQGRAVAIYDIGHVAQSMYVNISDNATFNTLSNTSEPYKVLSLKDIGVTNPKDGYGLPEYTDKVVLNKLTTGEKYYQVVNSDGAVSIDEKELEENGLATTVETVSENSVAKEEVSLVKEEVKETEKVAAYFNIDLYKLTKDKYNVEQVTENDQAITVTVDIPTNLTEVATGYKRQYYIIRIHDGEVTRLAAINNGDGTISFDTDKFSTYALVYEDVEVLEVSSTNEETVPQTSDNVSFNVALGTLSLAGLSIIGFTLKKENN